MNQNNVKELENEMAELFGVTYLYQISKGKLLRSFAELKKDRDLLRDHAIRLEAELYCSNPEHPVFKLRTNEFIVKLNDERLNRLKNPKRAKHTVRRKFAGLYF